MKISSPQGPTVPNSTNFSSNFTRILKVTETIKGNSFSSQNPATPDNNTILSGGTLGNINDPVIDSQGATYAYALAHSGASNPGGPIKAIQYNNAGVFGGSSDLLFDNLTNTLTANKISNGTVNIGANIISGLTNPISGQQAATKDYVDNYTSLTITTVNAIGATSYSATSVVNGIIYRNNQTSSTVIDTLPTAAQIIAASNAVVGTTITFGIRNTSSDYLSVVTFALGTGITIGSLQNIFAGYEYNSYMVVTSTTLGSEAITIYTIGNAITNTTNWLIELGALTTIVNVINITDFLPVFNNPSEIVEDFVRPSNVSDKISYYSPSGPHTIGMSIPDVFMGVFAGTSVISAPFIWSTGGTDFYIINNSAIPGADLTLLGNPGVIPWTMDPNSNMVIPAGYTGWFMVALTVTDYPNTASLTSARIYCLGVFPNT